jgi:hypothetical protein
VDFDGTHLQGHEQTFSAKLDVAGASSFWQANRDRASSEEDSDILRIGQVLEDKVPDIVWEAHELKSLLPLAKTLSEEILCSLELLADYGISALSVLSCEGECLGHVQSIDLNDLRSVVLVDNSYHAIRILEGHTYLNTRSLCANLREAQVR